MLQLCHAGAQHEAGACPSPSADRCRRAWCRCCRPRHSPHPPLNHCPLPFNSSSSAPQVLSGAVPPLPPRYSPELRSLVGAILQQNPAARPTIDDILQTTAVRAMSNCFG